MSRTRTLWTAGLTAAVAFVAAPVMAQDPQPAGEPQVQPTDDIIGVAQEQGYEEWTRGVQAAGLQERLAETPHTVFIADDAAYQQVPTTRTQAWQTDPEAHRAAVGHTIIEGRMTLDELRQREYVTTIDGRQLPVRVEGDQVWLGDAQIREGDIAAGPGMIHQVDQVTWPDPQPDPLPDPQPDPLPDQVELEDPQLQQPVREPMRKD